MTKAFATYLARIDGVLSNSRLNGSRDQQNDMRLYMFSRLSTIDKCRRAGRDHIGTANYLVGAYRDDVEAGDYWWR